MKGTRTPPPTTQNVKLADDVLALLKKGMACLTLGATIAPVGMCRSPACATKDGPILDLLSGYRPAMAKLGEVWVSSGLVRLLTRIFARDVTSPVPVQS